MVVYCGLSGSSRKICFDGCSDPRRSLEILGGSADWVKVVEEVRDLTVQEAKVDSSGANGEEGKGDGCGGQSAGDKGRKTPWLYREAERGSESSPRPDAPAMPYHFVPQESSARHPRPPLEGHARTMVRLKRTGNHPGK